MKWPAEYVMEVLRDLNAENPMACRAFLNVSRVSFTTDIPTLAVTIDARPELLINPAFLEEHVRSENDLRFLLLHEYFHILFLHTGNENGSQPAMNLAMDAVINNTIHRMWGEELSSFADRYYEDVFPYNLLRPSWAQDYRCGKSVVLSSIRFGLISGSMTSREICDIITESGITLPEDLNGMLIGRHGGEGGEVKDLRLRLDDHFRNVPELGRLFPERFEPRSRTVIRKESGRNRMRIWKHAASMLARRIIEGARVASGAESEAGIMQPVPRGGDRRALCRLYSGQELMPFFTHPAANPVLNDRIHVFLDVSGSMSRELSYMARMLAENRDSIHTPVWGFSTFVTEIEIGPGETLKYKSSGGTSIKPVFDWIRKNRISNAVILTDGYFEKITPEITEGIRTERVQFVITPGGRHQHLKPMRWFRLAPIPRDG